MRRFFYIDESGFNGDYVFVAVAVTNPEIPKKIIKAWRNWIKVKVKRFKQNEYHNYKARDDEKRRILREVSKHDDLTFWAVIKPGYNSNHKEFYVPVMVDLLKHCEINEKDTIIAVDEVDTKKIVMDRYIRKIKRSLDMPSLNIDYKKSEKEKGVQVADAIAGAVAKEYLSKSVGASYFDYICGQLKKDVEEI